MFFLYREEDRQSTTDCSDLDVSMEVDNDNCGQEQVGMITPQLDEIAGSSTLIGMFVS